MNESKIQKREDHKVYILVYFHGLNIADIFAYTGTDAAARASEHFEQLTGIPYAEYARLHAELDNHEILSEDDEGTEIYILEPSDAIGFGLKVAKGGIALWRVLVS